ncbi:MAG: Ig-like domain-containing protein [Reichenbachiella sp.]
MKKYFYLGLLCLSLVRMGVSQHLDKSDVLIADEHDQSLRDAYSATNIAWGFLPFGNLDDLSTMSAYLSEVNQIQSEGRTYHARVEFDAGWKNFIDYCINNGLTYADHACVSVDGIPYEYPWFAGSQYNGGSPLWMSSHSTVFMDFMKYQVDKTLEATVEVLMIDAQTSSALACKDQWNGGDFSTHAMDAFNTWLDTNFTAAELAVLGINDINTFNYRTYLNGLGITDIDGYKNRVQTHINGTNLLPLFDEYRIFNNVAIGDFTKDLIAYTETSGTGNLEVGSSSPVIDPYRATLIDELDFFQQELRVVMDDWTFEPVISYKIAENLGKDFVLTGDPGDWSEVLNGAVEEEEVKGWIANAYANGANFIAPARQWAYGSDYYEPNIDFTYIFDFIQDNKTLFDNHAPVSSKMAVIHSREAVRRYTNSINDVILALEANNINYDFVIAGDEYYPSTPTFAELDQYEKLIVSENVYDWYLANDPAWSSLISQLGDKVIQWGDRDLVSSLGAVKTGLTTSISVASGNSNIDDDVTAYPRKPIAGSGSYIVHLVNSDLNNSGQYVQKTNVSVTLKGDVFQFQNPIEHAIYHEPGQAPQNVTFSSANGEMTISGINALGFWGVLELMELGQYVDVSSVSVTPPNVTLAVNRTVQLLETVEPANANNKFVSWSTSNSTVATVSSSGLVTTHALGTAVITVTTNDGNFTVTSALTVVEAGTPIEFEAESFVATGGTALNNDNSVGFMIYSAGSITGINWNQTGDWGDYNVIVPEDGLYEFNAEVGTPDEGAAIEVSVDGSSAFLSTISSTGGWDTFVNQPLSGTAELTAGNHVFRMKGAGGIGWEWNADKFSIAKIGEFSNPIAVTSIALSPTNVSIEAGSNSQLTATISPLDASNKSVTWSSTNLAVATVSSSGLVTGIGAGSTLITVQTIDGNFTDTSAISVTVTPQPPIAEFNSDVTTVVVGNSINFTDLSTNSPTSWSWTFEGGTPATSNAQNPTVSYSTEGNYDVTLQATNADGSDGVTITGYMTVSAVTPTSPIADFLADITNVTEGGSVSFTDLSSNTPTSWSWTFAGGNPATSNAQHPQVSYSTAGIYDVTLTATNADGSDVETKVGFITVSEPSGSCSVLNTEGFESGWGIWSSGGSLARRVTYNANSGTSSVRLKKEGSSATVTTQDLDMSAYSSVEISFSLFTVGMDGMSVNIELSTDGGNSFNEVKTISECVDFTDDVRSAIVHQFTEAVLTGSTRIRIANVATSNKDNSFIDDIIIQGCGNSGARMMAKEQVFEDAVEISQQTMIYPNPASHSFHLRYFAQSEIELSVSVLSLEGRYMLSSHHDVTEGINDLIFDISELKSGVYLIEIIDDFGIKSVQRLLVQ